jgi:hypothetical protein
LFRTIFFRLDFGEPQIRSARIINRKLNALPAHRGAAE